MCHALYRAILQIRNKSKKMKSVCMMQSKTAEADALYASFNDVVYGFQLDTGKDLQVLVGKVDAGLCGGGDENVLDADMCRPRRGKNDAVGDVTSAQWLIAFVDG